ncbi:hypothetical protein GWI33_009651 [Rhynchophorus ferrugineus]|uniref:Uncharacterized protein n=1 Tax=Rhynchophorus ferrugineus TaxID=354439 RepID=A0A834IDB4_RHYFE|nr:hypothetical protein GWI33_009651 [Rhynchophorus ferrugineus]
MKNGPKKPPRPYIHTEYGPYFIQQVFEFVDFFFGDGKKPCLVSKHETKDDDGEDQLFDGFLLWRNLTTGRSPVGRRTLNRWSIMRL